MIKSLLLALSLTCGDADLNNDGVVGTNDILLILQYWGEEGADTNNDGTTNIQDLTYVLVYYGVECTE